MNKKDVVTICAVGDIADLQDYSGDQIIPLLEHVAPTIKRADIKFCQLETPLSERGAVLPQSRVGLRAHPKSIVQLNSAAFNVVSFACNHVMCMGADAFYDTVDNLKANNMNVLGVGKDIVEARKPVIMDIRGTKVAFLAYCSILPYGYWADEDRPGCAPMRGWTFYEQIEHDQPGTPARIHSFPHEEDLEKLLQDVKKAKSQADVVVMSIHWGIHFVPGAIASYQKAVGHAAIDAGVDLIIGHHPHMLKPVEVYNGKVIFYSLGNFAFYYVRPEKLTKSAKVQEILKLHPGFEIDPEYISYQFPAESRQTMLANVTISDKKIQRVSFLPAYINPKSQPQILAPEDKRFGELVQYMEKHTLEQKLETRYTIDGGEVVISR